MFSRAKCACGTVDQSVVLDDKHICNCDTCKMYVQSKTCTFFSTSLSDFNIEKTLSYRSGETSKRLFCSECFTFIGMIYEKHGCVYINSSIIDKYPRNLGTFRHIWSKK